MGEKKVICSIEARMGSSRLPGKVLLPVLGRPLLSYLIERIKLVKLVDEIVLATTINSEDDLLESFASKEGIRVYRGSEEDVMGRVLGAVESANGEIVVEITGDCPLIDPEITDQVIRTYLVNSVDYVSNNNIRSYPDGMDVQVFSRDALKRSMELTQNPLDREHVTLHIRNHPELFSRINLVAPQRLNLPSLGLTLDEIADYDLIKIIIENLYPRNKLFLCDEVLSYLNSNPQLLNLNKHVFRKGDA